MDVVKQLLWHQLVLAGAETSSLESTVATAEVTSMFLQNGTCVQIMSMVYQLYYNSWKLLPRTRTHARTPTRTYAFTHSHMSRSLKP